eukprot:CAMPEP_0204574624 /NCGR_PEP_ID=MMETSP0661-20131031/40710_1 /ASSEMBLY_ACC=CAM_ASM_000606 /TAXON_ID=109239 /ORGANISM="Alexandrium margalefi, Strain AMGDE01CS-322" /LENGTH=356 /DNA_ID=CAMNT_0051583167 /DNA_START=55 /DNA_END=1125 /DNA_ORIENTATION=-
MANGIVAWRLLASCLLVRASLVERALLSADDPQDCALSTLQLARVAKFGENSSARQQGTPECNFDTVYMFAHHKTGIALSKDAANAVNEALTSMGCLYSSIMEDWEHWGLLQDASALAIPRCFIHFERHPLEVVVSGYLYHLGTIESWTHWKFALCGEMPRWCPGKGYFCPWGTVDLWGELYWKGLCSLRSSPLIAAGRMAALLDNETFQEYLIRVDTDSALLANALYFASISWESVRAMHGLAERSCCAVNVCMDSFDTACSETWRRAFRIAAGVEEPALSGMVSAASTKCRGGKIGAVHSVKHSGDEESKKSGKVLPPKSELMARLRALDRELLGGSLEELAGKLGCGVSARYQ